MAQQDANAVTEWYKETTGDQCVVFETEGSSCTTDQALEKIEEAARNCTVELLIHYTGHGSSHTGGWCLDQGKDGHTIITFENVLDALHQAKFSGLEVTIFVDSCYSAHWLDEIQKDYYKGDYAKFCENSKTSQFTIWVITTDKTKQPVKWQTQIKHILQKKKNQLTDKKVGTKLLMYDHNGDAF